MKTLDVSSVRSLGDESLATEWAYARLYSCEAECQAAYPDFLDWYNYHRPHTGIGGQVPAARVTNLTEQHI